MDRSDSEYGALDEEDLLFATTQAEQLTSATEHFSSPCARKRRRFTDLIRGSEESLQRSSQNSEGLFVSQANEDEDEFDVEDGLDLEESPDKKKRKLKAHIPRNDTLYEDAFRTQISRSSESPYRIRGAIWQKPGAPPRALQPAKSVTGSPDQLVKKPLQWQSDAAQNILANDATSSSKNSLMIPIQDPPSPDAFDISDEDGLNEILEVSSQKDYEGQWKEATSKPRLVGPQKNLKQTTLFGTQSVEMINAEDNSNRRHNWPLANKAEKPTHHKLNSDELATYVYPINLGTIREYQYNIVARGLYHNLLVALPTGLGKTFIAATIMLNWFRWTKEAQIVFVAPTKPLVSQQVDACFHIAGIPRSATTMLTGGISPGIRAEEWLSKRVFFMTPQTFINDLKTGICDPKKIVLVVVDEAHRATGGYAYVEVVSFLRRFNNSFRVLALTATPGSTVESVQAVIDGLGISRVEIRTEESLDIRQYVHQRRIETMEFEPSEEMLWSFSALTKALQPLVDLMRSKNAYWSKDPMSLTAYGCNQARQKWFSSDAGRKASQGEKAQVMWVFATLASVAHSIELLKFHGITPFYHKIKAFKDEEKGGKYAKQVKDHPSFNDMMTKVRVWVTQPDFIGHPKLDYLQGTVLEHFVAASEGRHPDPEISPNKTRVMIFAHFRDSAEEIVRVLNRNNPMVRAHVFVGQASASGSEGMNQKKQLEIIEQFRQGIYNTIVATSIGEEGLDIGEVDLIICYDASASPIRMLQRMGRTGRKRAGEIVVLLMKGKETNNFASAKDNYEKMQQMIADGQRFTFHTNLSSRILPKEIQPVVDKRIVEIPIENTQSDLPEPKRRGRPPKRPPKKFNMPEGVRTGFVVASRLDGEDDEDAPEKHSSRKAKPKERKPTARDLKSQEDLSSVPLPPLASVLLTKAENTELEDRYLQIAGDDTETVEMPRLDAFPWLQRQRRPTVSIQHSQASARLKTMLVKMHRITSETIKHLEANLDEADTISAHSHSDATKRVTADPILSLTPKSIKQCMNVPKNKSFWTSPEKQPASLEASQDLPDLNELMSLNRAGQGQPKQSLAAPRRKRRVIVDSDDDDDE